jgi:hypothetical protein
MDLEMVYFERIQIQKQYIKSLLRRIGELESEVDHLNNELQLKSRFIRQDSKLISLSKTVTQLKIQNTKLATELWQLKLKDNSKPE